MSPQSAKQLTLRLDRILSTIAARAAEDRPLSYWTTVYRGEAEGLRAWFKHFNDGSPKLKHERLLEVRRELGLLVETKSSPAALRSPANTPGPARAKAAPPVPTGPRPASEFEEDAIAALVKLGRVRKWAVKRVAAAVAYYDKTPVKDAGELVTAALRLDCAPPAPAAAAPVAPAVSEDDGASPWAKRPQGPRTMKKHRPMLEALAAASAPGKGPKGKAESGFLSHWLGSTVPAPAKVRRFLVWCDAKTTKVAADEKAGPRAERPGFRLTGTPERGKSYLAEILGQLLGGPLKIEILITPQGGSAK